MALMKKVLLPLCVLILTLMICVYIPSSTTSIITIYSPKAMPRSRPFTGETSSQQTNNSDAQGALIRNLDSTYSSKNTTQPKEPTRVLTDQILANKRNVEMVTKQIEASRTERQNENTRIERMETESDMTFYHLLSNVSTASQYYYGSGNEDEGTNKQSADKLTNGIARQQEVHTKEESDSYDQDEVEFLRNINAISAKISSISVTHGINKETNNILSTRNDSSDENCKPITKIVFLKTHKTGSTTMASIFERFGYRRNLMFALPRSSHIFATNSFFSRKGVLPLPQVLARSHPYFDILDNHAVYYRPEMEKTVPNATYITILRDPVTQLESAFGYFEMAKGMGISKHPNPFEMFMQKPHFYYDTTKYTMKTRSRNGQLYDLGFINTKLFNNTSAILKKIVSLDEEFHLVLITEYFDESLILMKKTTLLEF
ncbi:uncharacterized protein [Amphiura filiformis]|uniref:uncharacterized protein n=1 Tax=Amphiura filiformis TaxID=82378 RepID=UPI003B20BBB6